MKPVEHSVGTELSEIDLDGVVGGYGIDGLAMGALGGALGAMMGGPVYVDGPGYYDDYGPDYAYGPEDYGPYGPEDYYA